MREVVWSHETARFRVELALEPEELDPADCFQFDDDVEAVRNGSVAWFCAAVRVYLDGREVAADYLGGCAYEPASDFWTAHRDPDDMNRNCSIFRAARGENVSICHYFPDMVRQAIAEARSYLGSVRGLYLRGMV